jgi:hypothetical protein
MLSTKIGLAGGPALTPDGPWYGLSVVAVWTVRACAGSIRISIFLWDLLAKPVKLTRELTSNGPDLPLYIDEGLRLIEPSQSIQSTLLIIFTLSIRSIPSLDVLHLESSTIFVSTPTRGVLGGLLALRHTQGSLLPTGSCWE